MHLLRVDNPPGENNCTGSEGGPVIRILLCDNGQDNDCDVGGGSAFGLPAKENLYEARGNENKKTWPRLTKPKGHNGSRFVSFRFDF